MMDNQDWEKTEDIQDVVENVQLSDVENEVKRELSSPTEETTLSEETRVKFKEKEQKIQKVEPQTQEIKQDVEQKREQKFEIDEKYKTQYWNITIPKVSKELNIDETSLREISFLLGIDSPDIFLKIKEDIAYIDNVLKKRLFPDEKIDNKSKTEKADIYSKSTERQQSGKSYSYNWLQIAEDIKRQRGLI